MYVGLKLLQEAINKILSANLINWKSVNAKIMDGSNILHKRSSLISVNSILNPISRVVNLYWHTNIFMVNQMTLEYKCFLCDKQIMSEIMDSFNGLATNNLNHWRSLLMLSFAAFQPCLGCSWQNGLPFLSFS